MKIFRSLTNKAKFNFAFTYPCPRKLREIMKMTLIEDEKPDRIKEIWTEYHTPRNENISSVLSKQKYEHLRKNALESSMFLVPIKRNNGHFMLLGQNTGKTFLYTYLEDFKKHGSNAAPYIVITLFDELLFSKELVLARGDIIDYKLNKKEANHVYEITEKMYLDPHYYNNYVYTFNHNQTAFSYENFRREFHLI